MTCCLIALAWMGLATAPPQSLDQIITYNQPARRLPVLLAELEKQTGVKLGSSPQFSNEVVFVHVRDRSLDSVLAKLATACGGVWTQGDDKRRLDPDLKLWTQQDTDQRTADYALITKALQDSLGIDRPVWTLQTAKDNIQKYMDAIRMDRSGEGSRQALADTRRYLTSASPASRVLSKITALLGAKDLASIPIYESRMFASDPSPLTGSLGQKCQPIISDFVTEQNMLLAQAADDDQGNRAINNIFSYHGPIVTPVRAYLKVKREDSYFQVVLDLVDADGYIIAKEEQDIFIPERPAENIFDSTWLKKPVAFSHLTLDCLRVEERGGLALATIDPKIHDPLSFAVSDILSAISEASQADIIAALPDKLVDDCSSQVSEGVTLERFQSIFSDRLKKQVQDGCLLFAPSKPSISRRRRLDRELFSKLLAAIARTRVPALSDVADYCRDAKPETAAANLEYYVQRWAGYDPNSDALQGIESVSSGTRELLKFYGCLDESQRKMLWSNQPMSVALLSSIQRESLSNWLFRHDTQLTRRQQKESAPTSGETILREPTVALSPGLPMTAVLGSRAENTLVGFSRKGAQLWRSWEAGSLGYILFQQEKGAFLDGGGYPAMSSEKFWPGFSRKLNLTLDFGSALNAHFQLVDESLIPNAAPVKWDALPADHLAELKRVLEYYRKADQARKPPPSQAARM